MPDTNTPQGVDCSSLEGLYEAALILLANSHKVANWTNGDEQTDVELGGKPTPSIRKLIALLNGIAGIATATTPGAVMPDGTTTKVDALGTLSAIGGNLQFNDDIWITESGTFTVPMTGTYEVLLFGGGTSGWVDVAGRYAASGPSGRIKSAFLWLVQGQEISVVVGAGGASAGPQESNAGGNTSFGEITTANAPRFAPNHSSAGGDNHLHPADGVGLFGGLVGSAPSAYTSQEARNSAYSASGHYGGSGAACVDQNGLYCVGAGAPGSVRLRFWNPAKANNPTPDIEESE